jgi:CDP-diacylglycerol--serine O-phosphatidyltransferase
MADLITSGLVPGIVMYQMLSAALYVDFFENPYALQWVLPENYIISYPIVPLLVFITAASALRLARFRYATTDSFIGVPTLPMPCSLFR